MDDLLAKMTADVLKSLAHPVRIKILQLLTPGERCVCELVDEIDIEQSNLSQHLNVLKKQGLISARKEGTRVMYRLLYPTVLDVLAAVEKTLAQQLSHSQDLLQHLERSE